MKQPKVGRAKETQPRPRRRQSPTLPEEQLRVTLYSIGDAVIVTDTQGRVTLMNPVAEALTGWNEADALGKPLAQIFHIINEETRTEVENPVARVLRDGVVIGLANHTLLIARDGREIPIADSGAPVRDAHGKIAGVVLVFRDQTKERQAQHLVHQARDFAESIVATAREPLVVLDAHLRVISANHAFYRTFQITPAETDGRPIYELGNRQWDIPELRALLEQILPHNSHFDDFVVEHEFERIGKRTMLLNARRIRHDPNQTQMILLAIEDISDRQRAADALRESEERYRTFIQQANDYIFTLNTNGQITSANRIMCQDLGYAEEELLGKSALDLVTPQKREEAAQALHRIWSGESVDQFEVPIQTRDGKTIFVQIRGRSIYQDGKFVETLHIARNITDRKRAEDALRESEERFRTLAETTATAIFVYAGDKFIYGNRAAQELTGYTAKELFAMHFWDVVHPDFREMIRQRGLARQRGEEIPARYEFKIVRKDGSERWIDFTAGRIEWQGQPAAIGSAFDITERKRAEEALRASENLLAEAQRIGKLGHAEWVAGKDEIICSEETLRIFELPRDGRPITKEMLGERIHPEDRQRLAELDRQFFAERADLDYEYRLLLPDNRPRWVHQHAKVTYDENGAPIRVITVFQDITERKQAEEALRESEARFRIALENSPIVVFNQDRELRYTWIYNPHPGFDPQAVLGKTDAELLPADDAARLISIKRRVLETGVTAREEVKTTIGGQAFFYDLTVEPLRDASGNIIGVTCASLDITERKQAEEALAASEAELRVLFASMQDVVLVIDREGVYRKIAPTNPDLLYKPPEELLGKNLRDVFPAEQAEAFLDSIRQTLETRQTTRIEYALEINQRLLWFSASISPMDNDNTLWVARDITERKMAEKALRENEEKFKTLFNSANDAIFTMNHTTFLDCNATTEKIFRCSKDQIIGRSPVDFSPEYQPDGRRSSEAATEKIEAAFAGTPQFFEWLHTHLDGTPFHAEVSLNRVFIGGEFILQAIVRDITERKHHERELEAEAMIAQALNETSELQPLLERLIAAVMRAIPAAQKGSLALLSDAEHLQVRALYGYQDSAVLGFTYPTTWGYAGRAVRERRPLLITDIQADSALQADAQNASIAEVQSLRSAIIAPLFARETIIGVISLESTQPNVFNEHDLRLLTNIATTAALAIERARLFAESHRRAEQEARLNELGRALATTLDLKTIYRTTHTHLQALVDCPNFAISLFDPVAQTIRVDYVRTNGDEPDPSLLPPLKFDPQDAGGGRSLAIASQTPVIVDDLIAKARASGAITIGNEQLPDSAIYVPMIVEGKVLGLLELQSYHPHAYSPEDANLLGTAANQIGLAIQNARLFEDLRIRLTELETLHTIASLCIQATDENSLLEQITNVIGNNLYPDNFGFLLLNAEGTHLLAHSSYRGVTLNNIPTQIPLNAGITGRVAASGKPYRTGDVRREDAYIEINPATRSELCVPLIVGGRVLGVINAESHKLNAFSEADEHLLMTAASQVATALERLRLLNETQRRLAELQVLQQVSAALRVAHTAQEMIPIFITHATRAVAARAGSIYLLEEASGDWVSQGWLNESGEWIAMPGAALRHHAGEGVTGRVGATGEIYVTADWRTDPATVIQPGEETLLNELGGSISLPLRAEQRIIGVMHVWFAQTPSLTEQTRHLLTAIADIAGNALQRARLFEETQRRLDELDALHQASQTLLGSPLDPEAAYAAVHQAVAQVMPCDALSIVLKDETLDDYDGVYLFDKAGRSPVQRIPRGQGLSGWVIPSGKTLLIDDYPVQDEIRAVHYGSPEHVRAILAVPLRIGDRTIGMLATQSYQPNAFSQQHQVLLETLAAQFATTIENARLYEQTRLRLRELEVVSTVSAALRTAPTHNEMFPVILDQLIHLLDVDGAAIEMLDPNTGDLITQLGRGVWASLTGERIPAGKGLSAQVLATGEPYLNNDARNDPRLFHPDAFGDCRAAAGVLLRVKTQTIGLLWLASRRPLTEHDLRLLTAIADIAANAIHRAALNEQTERHLSQLATLHAIDRAISSSFDLRLTLNILLEHVTTQLGVDAASILLWNPQTQLLEYAASRGFRTRAIEQARLRLGESFAGRVALERQSIHIRDLPAHAKEFVVTELVAEGFAEYYGAPLIAKGNVVGVMQIFHHAPLPNDKEWFDFCTMLAGQAAIAIDNARLFNDLQQANTELARAYDATIEGWSRALDLRDKETEGHTQRVTELTLKLARAFGISESDLSHVRRGALLHDIGKMGVPDSILLKPGKLTDAEMAIMREHPRYAYELLLPIEYLRDALDIPYCHHEKWDGTGYPRRLKGEDIPLVARLFAIVDVYDALTSDRPYRPAWSKEQALAYLREQAGKHFDPKVVEMFLKLFGASE